MPKSIVDPKKSRAELSAPRSKMTTFRFTLLGEEMIYSKQDGFDRVCIHEKVVCDSRLSALISTKKSPVL